MELALLRMSENRVMAEMESDDLRLKLEAKESELIKCQEDLKMSDDENSRLKLRI